MPPPPIKIEFAPRSIGKHPSRMSFTISLKQFKQLPSEMQIELIRIAHKDDSRAATQDMISHALEKEMLSATYHHLRDLERFLQLAKMVGLESSIVYKDAQSRFDALQCVALEKIREAINCDAD